MNDREKIETAARLKIARRVHVRHGAGSIRGDVADPRGRLVPCRGEKDENGATLSEGCGVREGLACQHPTRAVGSFVHPSRLRAQARFLAERGIVTTPEPV